MVIVDDEVTLAVVMRTLVQQTWPGARVTVFTEPQDLPLRLLEVPVGSVVLMDRRLGGVDSYEIIRTLLAGRPDVRVAMLSASLGPEEITRARHAGAFAAYEKPAALGEWRQLLAQMVPAPSDPRAQSGPAVA
ncbi:MAG: response regulator [Chloroflexi bacterium]|nr:MAG: response regulator [Chloroflexota bacterium]